ncbi:hypothetical protein SAPIO_CDS7590 [Scedosporium apiospermum]|uniref:Oligopeptide transporter n=1 Tax=Pseudallescheria apiosperma TaxID=563466 RepID=A0A084G292_PSEDA|nr:uncharacterized protein SAPIO_CDS7590 [Scedosporium apiospermum]KEZ41454.1 hypothetical protein SAPIO_CDS7590 [Scedosporium apiospermum]
MTEKVAQNEKTGSSETDDFQGQRDATQEEIDSLPHVADKLPFAAWAVILAGAFERFTYFGLIAPWHIWLGRFKTLMIGLALYLAGCIILVTTSIPDALNQGAGIGGLATCLVLVGLGVGSVKATFFPLLGDQYVQKKPQLVQSENGARVIVDGPRTIQLMYNAYYWFANVASLSSIPVTFLEFHYGFWVAYLLTTISLCVSIAFFAIWSGKLVKIAPKGNVLPRAVKTMSYAARSGFKLDHAKPSYQQTRHGRTVPWTDHFVDEMKRGLIACRVIFSLLVFYLCINQMYNNLVSQAGQMDLHGVPNDMIQAFSGVACIIFGPIIQGLYEILAKRKIEFGPIARMTAAFIFCGAGMGYAAGLQRLIYSSGPCYDRPFSCPESEGGKIPNSVNVWAQMPVYIFLAIGEIFGFVTAFEYAYGKAPKDMKTVVQALTQLTACFASVLGMAISPAAKVPNMVIFYACLAGAMGLTAVLFWWRFRKYDEIDTELNQLDYKEEVFESTSPASDEEKAVKS